MGLALAAFFYNKCLEMIWKLKRLYLLLKREFIIDRNLGLSHILLFGLILFGAGVGGEVVLGLAGFGFATVPLKWSGRLHTLGNLDSFRVKLDPGFLGLHGVVGG